MIHTLCALFISAVLLVISINVTAQAADITDVQDINTRVKTVQIQQTNESEIKNEIQKRTEQNAELSKVLLELKEKQVQLEISLNTEKSKVNPDQATITQIETALQDIQKSITETEATIEGNKTYIQEGEITIQTKKQEIKNDLFTLQDEVITALKTYSFYGAILISSYFLFRLFKHAISTQVKHEQWSRLFHLIVNTLFFGVIMVLVFILTAGNITAIITSFGFVSAALVVVLQDFISSLFAFIYIKLQQLYRENDVISIAVQSHVHAGIVDTIGPFRTTIKELEDTNGLNSERHTGRVISFPNNAILQDSLTNYTKEHRNLWHSFTVTVTFETDMNNAQHITKEAVHEVFNTMITHKSTWFDLVPKLKVLFEPRVYMTLADSGFQFHIWFACKYGKYTESIELYSTKIYELYQLNHIDLAYTTQRVLIQHSS